MNDAYYTQTGERPDLAAVEVNAPEGYIGTKILPIVPVTEKTGVIYYATVTADATAQTGRSAGAAPADAGQIADSAGSFTCAEAVKRGKIAPDEVKTMGGIEKADIVGAKWAKRQVMNYLEGDIRTIILGKDPSDAFDSAKFLTDAQTALETIRLYEGKSTLIASTIVLKRMVQQLIGDTTYGAVFSRLIAGTSPAVAAGGMNLQAWLNGLAMFIGVDQVLAGCDSIWNATAVEGKFAFAKLDDGTDELSHKWRPVLGKTFQFMPDGQNPWLITSVPDRVLINNYYDAFIWQDTQLLNTGALYVFEGVAA